MDNITAHNYSVLKSSPPPTHCQSIEEYTKAHVALPQMIIGPLEASFLGFLTRIIGAKKVLELGTFTGYSALNFASNLPEDGKVITIDINPNTTKIAQSFWDQSPHGKKITAKMGDGLTLLSEINETMDLIFIDADKRNYPHYFKKALSLLSPKGVIIFDNAFWDGRVFTDEDQAGDTLGIKKVTDEIATDPTLYKTIIPIRDGMLLVTRQS